LKIEAQVEAHVRKLFAVHGKIQIRDLAKNVATEFDKLDKKYIKDLLTPILKNTCKYVLHDGVKYLTLMNS